MAVLFIYINALSATGGLQKFNRNFLDALEPIAKDETIYALSLHDSKIDFPKNSPIIMETASGSRLRFIWKSFVLGWKSRKVIVGHINLLFPLVFLLRRPMVLITHGIEIWRPLPKYKRGALKRISEVVTVSNFTKKRIETIFPFLKDKLSLLPNTIDKEFEGKSKYADNGWLQKKYGVSLDTKIILTVCRLSLGEDEKGYDKVMKCLPKLIEQGINFKYVLAGKYDLAEKKRLDELIETLNLQEHVLFTGFIKNEDLPSVYASTDVFIMPSKKEGFGIVFLEALMLGKPVIGGNQDGTQDALLCGETGILIDPDSEIEIAGALENVLLKKIDDRLLNPEFLREKSLNAYGFEKYLERVRILVSK